MNTATPLVSKSLVQSHRQCARRAWLEAHATVQPQFSASALAIKEQGHEVHAAGRTLFPGMVMVPPTAALADAARQTQVVLSAGAAFVGEAAFVAGNFGVRLDVLERLSPTGYRIIEIKSGSEVKDEYVEDAAIQFACATLAGLPVQSVAIMHPSTSRVLRAGESGACVLVSELVTDRVEARAGVVASWVEATAKTLAGSEPACTPGDQCSSPTECPFAHHCGKPAVNSDPDRIEFLPSKSERAIKAIIGAGATTISELPSQLMRHAGNSIMHRAIQANCTVIDRRFAEALAALPFPQFHIDFEAASFAIPRFVGTRSYQPISFQWSVHSQAYRGAKPTHSEFLDVSGADPRRGFIESLLSAVGSTGPVFVYSAYERTRLRDLAVAFPDLLDPIMALIGRLVDLLPMARAGYYDPSMMGSWSLKKIVPTLPPHPLLTKYTDLEGVTEGTGAQAAYMNQINPAIVGPAKERERQNMLAYCETDTAALFVFVITVIASLYPSPAQPTNGQDDDPQGEQIALAVAG